MSLTRIRDTAVEIIRNLPNRPTGFGGRMSAAALKMAFDQAAENIKNAVNQMIGELEGTGGAAEIGFQRSTGVPADTVQSAIENVQQQLAGASQGAVPNNSISTEKLVDGAVTSDKIHNGAVTGEKLADDAFEWVNLVEPEEWEYNRLQPTTQTDYDSNALDFYYCKKLGLMYVAGWVEFEISDDHMLRAIFDLPKRRNGFSHVAFASELKVNMSHNPSMQETVDIDTSDKLRVFVEGASQSEIGKTAVVYLSGIYLCKEGS